MSMNTPTILLSQLDLATSNISPIRLPSPRWSHASHSQSYQFTPPSHTPRGQEFTSPSKRPNSSPQPSPPHHKRRQTSINPSIFQDQVDLNSFSLPSTPTVSRTTPLKQASRLSTLTTPTHRTSEPTNTQSQSDSASSSNASPTPQGPQQRIQTSVPRTTIPPSENLEDPLAPRPESYSEGFYGAPQIKYYTKSDIPADQEFERILKSPILGYMEKKKYPSFCVVLCHAGYERSTSVPVVLVCAADMPDIDALELTDMFDNIPERRLVRRVFIFDAATQLHVMESHLKRHQAMPTPGASVGVRGVDSAFSLGVYFRLSDDESLYCTTVHHGITKLPTSIKPNTTPLIIVEQPSCVDLEIDIVDALEELDRALDAEGVRRHANVKDLYNRVYDLLDLNVEFGELMASEFDVLEYGGRPINSDVAIIRVSASRHGINRIPFPFAWASSNDEWVPRDYHGIYAVGFDYIRDGTIVAKSGRASGTTEGKISFRYCYANLEGTGTTTSEYCVISETPRNLFCEKGDSGAPVVDKKGCIVGAVLGGTYGVPKKLIGYDNLGEVYASYITPIHLILERIKVITDKDATIVIPNLDEVERSGMKVIRKDALHSELHSD